MRPWQLAVAFLLGGLLVPREASALTVTVLTIDGTPSRTWARGPWVGLSQSDLPPGSYSPGPAETFVAQHDDPSSASYARSTLEISVAEGAAVLEARSRLDPTTDSLGEFVGFSAVYFTVDEDVDYQISGLWGGVGFTTYRNSVTLLGFASTPPYQTMLYNSLQDVSEYPYHTLDTPMSVAYGTGEAGSSGSATGTLTAGTTYVMSAAMSGFRSGPYSNLGDAGIASGYEADFQGRFTLTLTERATSGDVPEPASIALTALAAGAIAARRGSRTSI